MRVLGLMTGTSVDAVDVVLASFGEVEADASLRVRVEASYEVPFAPSLAESLRRAVTHPFEVDLPTLIELDAALGEFLGEVCCLAIARAGGGVDLIVSPGQTLYHHAPNSGTVRTRGSLAIGSPEHIHEATGVPVLSHVRAADIAAGGTGAPLAPILDALIAPEEGAAFLNIGGIANLTLVGPRDADAGRPVVVAGDTGPGNGLIDACAEARLGEPCDRDGAAAARGPVNDALLEALLADPYFAAGFPASTGREYFSWPWLERRAQAAGVCVDDVPTEDLLATLTELTASSVARAYARATGTGPGSRALHVAGGGAHNRTLLGRLGRHLYLELGPRAPEIRVGVQYGIDPSLKEALLMATVGWLSLHGIPATGLPSARAGEREPTGSTAGASTNSPTAETSTASPTAGSRAAWPTVTGAAHPSVLGRLTPPAASLVNHSSVRPPRRLIVENENDF